MFKFIVLVLLTFSVVLPSFSAEDNYQFDTPQMRQSFQALTETLRCPKCQNQNIADSDAMIAHDMRRKVYQLLLQGKSEEEVVQYMTSRYGNFVSYKPPVTLSTSLLWLLPIGFVLFGAVGFLIRGKLSNNINASTSDKEREANALKKANKMLEQD